MKKLFDRACITVTCIVLSVLTLLFFVLPDNDFSAAENRMLSKAPEFSLKKLASGEYTEKACDYISDQFPFRDFFIGVKAYAELVAGRHENNGVLYGKGGILIPHTEQSGSRLSENIGIIDEFSRNTDVEVTVAAVPRTIDVFSEYLPLSYPYEKDKEIWHELEKKMGDSNLNYVELYDTLCESNAYYRTDHHYTSRGAYLVYELLGKELQYTPKAEDKFRKETVTEDFCGTAMRTSGFYLAKRDFIDLFRYDNDTRYTVTADKKEIGLYDLTKLDTADKYAVFLGGNHARVDITDGTKERERLLIIRDSFADSIAPFLAIHYDLTLIDLRYFKNSVAQIVKNEGITRVLVLESISELSTAKNISYLLME